MKNSNKIVVDLKKVSHAQLKWCSNSYGRKYSRERKPTYPTVNGHEFDIFAKRPGVFIDTDMQREYRDVTMLFYAECRGLLDTWYPELELQLSNNHSLIYTGDKALLLWEAYKGMIFCSKKGK